MPCFLRSKQLLVNFLILSVPCIALADAPSAPAEKKPSPAKAAGKSNSAPDIDHPQRQTPTIENAVYGHDSLSQVYDFWAAKSDKPTPIVIMIHSGSWLGRD